MIKLILLALVMSAVVALNGCAWGEGRATPDFQPDNINRLAVISVLGARMTEAERSAVADYYTMELVERGYRVIERSQVELIIEEQGFRSQQDIERGAARIGGILDVDAVVLINISDWGRNLAMTARLVEVETGSVMWVGAGEASTREGMTTIVGTVFGAGLGVLIGRRASRSGAIGGGIVGGTAGGAGGALLEPHKARLVRRVVERVCESLPPASGMPRL